MKHPAPDVLALYAGRDLNLWTMIRTAAHVYRCAQCAGQARSLGHARAQLKAEAMEMPAGLNWDEMAAEMRANIRLGLTAGAIVAETPESHFSPREPWPWQLGVVMASVALVAVLSWILPAPPADHTFQRAAAAPVFLETQAGGLALQDHGSALTLLSPEKTAATTTVSWDGGARASYVDPETGQVTIHHVSAQ